MPIDADPGTSVEFSHEVWDHTGDCPVEGAGPVTVQVTENPTVTTLPTLAIGDVMVSEDAGNAVFTVTLSQHSTDTVTVEYETFTVTMSNPQNATLLDAEGRATITDDDGDGPPPPPELPALAIDDVTVSEGGGSAVFSVRLSGQSTETVRVAYETSDRTATAGSDYASASGNLVFQSGETSKTIAVSVRDDSVEEENETFAVILSNPQNATLLDAEGRATIVDNDGDGPPPPHCRR